MEQVNEQDTRLDEMQKEVIAASWDLADRTQEVFTAHSATILALLAMDLSRKLTTIADFIHQTVGFV